jgi:NAD(P)-dependent dehydrogenase (short-subunit alcohol dehydrogenase family)
MAKAWKTALVTGGAKRIGRAIVKDLAAHGFAVAIHCHNSHKDADELAKRIIAQGGRAAVIQADLTDMAAAAKVVADANAALGPLSLLVNSASLFTDDSVENFDWVEWDRHFAIHLKAPAQLARDFAAQLPPDAEGLIVNIIDQRVWHLTPRYFSYTLSKSALWTATQTMALALANERQQPADFQAQIDGLILGRGPALAEFGATIRYLWDARSVTGQMIAIDGGQHLAWQTPDVTGMIE